MQAVEVGQGRVDQVVGVKDSLQSHDDEEQGEDVQCGVKHLDVDLTVVTEHAVNQDS